MLIWMLSQLQSAWIGPISHFWPVKPLSQIQSEPTFMPFWQSVALVTSGTSSVVLAEVGLAVVTVSSVFRVETVVVSSTILKFGLSIVMSWLFRPKLSPISTTPQISPLDRREQYSHSPGHGASPQYCRPPFGWGQWHTGSEWGLIIAYPGEQSKSAKSANWQRDPVNP